MKLKKTVGVLLAGTMAVSLAACGSSATTSSPKESAASESEGGTESNNLSGSINIWEHTYVEKEMDALISAFNKKYPNIEVNYEIKADGDYDSLIKTAIQSGDGPDLFWTNGTATATMLDFVKNGVLADLTDRVNYGFISDSAMKLANVDGKSYSVPWLTLDTRTCYYNKDMFKENGWTVPKTFSEFEALMASVKKAGITPVSLSIEPWCLLFAYEPILAAYDHTYTEGLSDYSVKATDEPARACMKKMVEWSDAGYFGDNWFGVTDADAQVLAFTTGKAAMMISGSWDAAAIADNNPNLNYGAFCVPSEDGTTELVGTCANGFSVNADSKNLDAAIAFANFCATKEAQTIWIQTAGAVSSTPEIESSTEVAKEISQSGKGKLCRSWQNVLSSYSEDGIASTIFTEDVSKVFSGDLTVDEFMDSLAKEME